MSKFRYNPEGISKILSNKDTEWSKLIDYLQPDQVYSNKQPSRITNLADLTSYIDNSNTVESLNVADNSITSLSNMIQNPMDIIAISGAKQDISNKRIELDNYKTFLDEASNMAANFENYRVDDYKNMSIEDINIELRKIRDFNSYVYKDLEKKEFNNFVGNHSSGGKNDKQIINRINEYEKSLTATVEALYNDGVVQDHEVFFILTGDKEGLDAAKTSNVERISNNIKSKVKSINSVKSYMKQLINTMAKEDIKGNEEFQNFTFTNDSIELVKESAKLATITDGSRFEGMDIDDVIEQKSAEMINMTWSEVLDVYQNEIKMYESGLDKENTEYYKWTGKDFMVADFVGKDRKEAADNEISKALESYYEDLSPELQALDDVDKSFRNKDEADLIMRYGTSDPNEIRKIIESVMSDFIKTK
jgi:hypothetical protein